MFWCCVLVHSKGFPLHRLGLLRRRCLVPCRFTLRVFTVLVDVERFTHGNLRAREERPASGRVRALHRYQRQRCAWAGRGGAQSHDHQHTLRSAEGGAEVAVVVIVGSVRERDLFGHWASRLTPALLLGGANRYAARNRESCSFDVKKLCTGARVAALGVSHLRNLECGARCGSLSWSSLDC